MRMAEKMSIIIPTMMSSTLSASRKPIRESMCSLVHATIFSGTPAVAR